MGEDDLLDILVVGKGVVTNRAGVVQRQRTRDVTAEEGVLIDQLDVLNTGQLLKRGTAVECAVFDGF